MLGYTEEGFKVLRYVFSQHVAKRDIGRFITHVSFVKGKESIHLTARYRELIAN